ncbi:hypothetical protein DM860_002669 [Cuscuta australis]|uniref:Uncharacterized protein n=1 Tax=Cuscuta australis TaxID=267555 RepID=A0A328D2Q8_9ASTE|nr:hypothetical protein DM860_002669 [Cuscuta australis]
MASPSPDPMDDGSFRARVHKVFSSLSSSPLPISAVSKPLWSLTDDEVEKRDWNRSKSKLGQDDDNTICSSSFDGLFKRNRGGRPKGFGDIDCVTGDEDGDKEGFDDDLEDLSGEEDGDRSDFREIRSSVGLDSTLDYEEEEDEFDRFAEGNGKTSNCFRKDPRADQHAAQIRLREDDVEASKHKPNHPKTEPSGENCEGTSISVDCSNVKPILKRKDNSEGKSRKRVRFDPSFVDESDEYPQARPLVSFEVSSMSSSDGNKPKVPDHLINPSKYTRYSLDSCSEIDTVSNNQACKYVLEEVNKWTQNRKTEASSNALPQSISFVLKKSSSSVVMEDVREDASKVSGNQQSFPVPIAAWEELESETIEGDREMEDGDDNGVCKPDRHYRSKSRLENHLT